ADLTAGTGRPGDDPARHAETTLERQCVPDRDDVVADLHLVGVVGAHGRKVAGVHLEDRDVRARITSHDAGVDGTPIVWRTLRRLRFADDVRVRREVAVVREDEGRPRALAPALVHRDGGDGRLDLGDDAGDVAVAADRRRVARDLVRPLGHRGRVGGVV